MRFFTILITLALCAGGASAQNPSHFVVNANNVNWTSTGMIVDSSVEVLINATGCCTPDRSVWCDPDGRMGCGTEPPIGPCVMGPEFRCDTVQCYSLVGRIGTGSCFFVGVSAVFVPTEGGELQLGFNDQTAAYGDNSGTYEVDVRTEGGTPVDARTWGKIKALYH